MSHDGTTCWSSPPRWYVPTVANVVGSITRTSPERVCGT